MKQNKLYTKNEGGNASHTRSCEKHPRYKWERHTKKSILDFEEEISHTPIKKRYKNFIDYGAKNYTPLYKYLLTQVGKDWDKVWKDVFPRVDGNAECIQRMVANINKHGNVIELTDKRPTFNYDFRYYGERRFSRLYVDENNILQYIDKNHRPPIFYGGGWGQSFNGKPQKEKYSYSQIEKYNKLYP